MRNRSRKVRRKRRINTKRFLLFLSIALLAGITIGIGINAGIKTVLLESVYKTELLNKKTSADYVLKDLRELIGII